jgi:hypothetical protein
MFRVRNSRKRWRLRWPWRWFFPLGGQYADDYGVSFGRWVGRGRSRFLSELIPERELDSLLEVAAQARDEYYRRTDARRARR